MSRQVDVWGLRAVDEHGCVPHVGGGHFPWAGGLYGKGMPDFILREMEVGLRAAYAEDDEYVNGWMPDDLFFDRSRVFSPRASPAP